MFRLDLKHPCRKFCRDYFSTQWQQYIELHLDEDIKLLRRSCLSYSPNFINSGTYYKLSGKFNISRDIYKKVYTISI